ncbi:zinc finger BED domain-containing protein 5-like [Parasteatoda tepidariorum]|uniref:zinc finger BED domain-containing protein 5-like n=1 Tax=Parasteatoda tepidariorum TaxID=114398 RepID=UPI0039BC8F23
MALTHSSHLANIKVHELSQEYLQKTHPDKQNKDLSFFTNIQEFLKAPLVSGLLATSSKKCDDYLIAFYNISKFIADSGKANTIGTELILTVVKEVLETVLHHPVTSYVIKNFPLSNDTVRGRNGEMAEDVEVSLCILLISREFSLQVDESTFPCNISFTVGVGPVCKEKNIPPANIMSIATKGAPAMIGRRRGFIALLKSDIPDILAVHCMIHRQQLVGKNLSDRLHQLLQNIIYLL